MRLKFLELIIRDFKSFVGEHVLQLDRRPGVHFVRGVNRDERRLGSNGSGKTSLWDAFVWCLYGRTPSGLRNPDVKPWRGAEVGTRVSLRLEVAGKRHTIRRTASTNGITLDGDGVGQGEIDKLLGISFMTMTNSMIVGQGQGLFLDASPAAKMQLLSDVKELDRWDARSKRAAECTHALTEELVQLQTDEYASKRSLDEVGRELKLAQRDEDRWIETEEREAKERARVAKDLAGKIEKLTNELGELDLKYDGAGTEAKSCELQMEKLVEERSTIQTDLFTARARRIQLREKIERLEGEMPKLRSARCPTCNGLIVNKDVLDDMRTNKLAAIEEMRDALRQIKTRRLVAALDIIDGRLASTKSYLASFRAKADGALHDYKFKQTTLADLRVQAKASEGATAVNPYTKQRRALRAKRIYLLDEYEGLRQDVKSCARELEQVKYWPKGFKEIKLHIIEELLQELELVTCGMLEEVGLVGWRVRYVIERETKSGTTRRALAVMIASPKSKGKLVRWESWSGGEKQRLRVIGSLALASVLLGHAGVIPNIEVLDEPTTHLSDEGVDDICAYLAERARTENRVIFYADQQSVDGMAFASTITVKRDKTGSRIIQ